MKIKTQFVICIVVFSLILIVIAASVATTEQQVAQLNAQEQISSNIERGASSLNTISVDYFLYQEDTKLSQWQTELSSLSTDLENLKPSNAQQQTLANNVNNDLQRLNTLFENLTVYLQSAPRNISVRIDPAFQQRWRNMAVQSQAVASDASQLSRSLDDQAHQANEANILLIVSLVGTFGALLATIYLMVFRKTLKSVEELQNGIRTIGSGNLDYTIKIKGQNEITELSRSFNQMTTNLKTVTASKTDLEQAQASLRESEQRWSTTLASIGDAVIATDLSGKIIFMNGVAEELTRWTLREASLKPVKEVFNIINEQTHVMVEDPVSKVLEKGLIVGLANHTVLIRKNKTELAIDDSGAPIKDKDGKTTGVVLIFRDITERKKAEGDVLEQKLRAERYLNIVGNIILALNVQGKITLLNKKGYEILGYEEGELTGKDWVDTCLPKEIREELRKVFDWWVQGKAKTPEQYENTIVTKYGEKRLVSWHNTEIRDEKGQIIGTLSSGEDITERKNDEEKLEEYRMNLEKLVEERTKQLKDAERLAAIGATAGMVGHDIRNPLQAITGDVYLAKIELASISESEEKNNTLESLTEIEKNVDYINKIVADLQDFARPLNPRLEEANLKLIIDELLSKNELPENVKVSVKVETAAEKVLADSSYINRIMYNLVTNAVQAMPKGGKLTIKAHKDKKTNDAVITVEDTGVGITEEAKTKLFTPMFTTKSKGQGFGLAVVKRMTEALGGTVTFESQEGKGTTFIVRLPPPKR